jgi:hypothetical protein
MDPVSTSNVSQSIEAVNQILQQANQQSTEMAEKLMKVGVEMSLAAEPGKGENVDLMA